MDGNGLSIKFLNTENCGKAANFESHLWDICGKIWAGTLLFSTLGGTFAVRNGYIIYIYIFAF